MHQPSVKPPSPVILAIETSGNCGSVALFSETRCTGEISLSSKTTHSRRLLKSIDWIMHECGTSWSDISAVAVSLGPGSFTGLRIGLSTAKGLAMAASLPLIGVPTLDGLAQQLAFQDTLVCPVLDARKKEIYCGLYRSRTGTPLMERVSDFMNLPPEALAAMIDEPVILVGDGLETYEAVFRQRLGGKALIPSPIAFFPRASSIGAVAVEMWHRREFLPPENSAPIYVRLSDAELNWVDPAQRQRSR